MNSSYARISCLILTCLFAFTHPARAEKILVYTKNQIGKGLFVHDNIAASVVALQKLGTENQFGVDVSSNALDFSTTNLSQYKVIVFDNSNNEILDTGNEKAALQGFVRHGGGIVGIHCASGSMRHWPWFAEMMGGTFIRHAGLQPFTIHVVDPTNISVAHFPTTFQWTDEFYYLTNMPSGLHVLLTGDATTVKDPKKQTSENPAYGDNVPLCFCHEFDGGREWYTALGHKKQVYADPVFTKHLLGGILWAMGKMDTNTTK